VVGTVIPLQLVAMVPPGIIVTGLALILPLDVSAMVHDWFEGSESPAELKASIL